MSKDKILWQSMKAIFSPLLIEPITTNVRKKLYRLKTSNWNHRWITSSKRCPTTLLSSNNSNHAIPSKTPQARPAKTIDPILSKDNRTKLTKITTATKEAMTCTNNVNKSNHLCPIRFLRHAQLSFLMCAR